MDLLPPPTPTAKKRTATTTPNQKTLPVPEPTPKKPKSSAKKLDHNDDPILSHMSEMRNVFRDLASSLNCPTPSPSPAPATPAASHMALSIDENLQRVPPHLRMRCQIEIFQVLDRYQNQQTDRHFSQLTSRPSTSSLIGLAYSICDDLYFKRVKFPGSKYCNILVNFVKLSS